MENNKHQRLYINIDHVATLRQARRGKEPDPIEAARVCESAGADGITAHLREDRRHVQDADIEGLKKSVRSYLNLEMACVNEMLAIALRIKPQQVTLVPERREEITTEGGLNVMANQDEIARIIVELKSSGIRTSLFIDPDVDTVTVSRDLGADAVELHTGKYAMRSGSEKYANALRDAASHASEIKLAVHAGHGLNVKNVEAIAAIPEIEELNIGHSIVSRALFIGLAGAVREMREIIDRTRAEIA